MDWKLIISNVASKKAIITAMAIWALYELAGKSPTEAPRCVYAIAGLAVVYMACNMISSVLGKNDDKNGTETKIETGEPK